MVKTVPEFNLWWNLRKVLHPLDLNLDTTYKIG